MVQFLWGAEQKIIEWNAYRMTGLTAPGFLRGFVGRSKNLSAPHYFYKYMLDIFAQCDILISCPGKLKIEFERKKNHDEKETSENL